MRKNNGFSLLIVMILSMVSLILVGAALNIMDRSSVSGKVSVRSGNSYNILQSEIERARFVLKAEMSSRKEAIKCGLSDTETIDSLEDLEVLKDGVPFWRIDYRENVGGMAGDVSVRIYDMQYSPENVVSGDLVTALPPSIGLTATNAAVDEVTEPGISNQAGGSTLDAGVYLIRATITFANKVTNKIDVSVIQNANPKT